MDFFCVVLENRWELKCSCREIDLDFYIILEKYIISRLIYSMREWNSYNFRYLGRKKLIFLIFEGCKKKNMFFGWNIELDDFESFFLWLDLLNLW